MSIGRRVFLAVLLSQLFSIALIFGWYFSVLRSELDSLTRRAAQIAVLQSIAATEDYLKPAVLAAVTRYELISFGFVAAVSLTGVGLLSTLLF